jgi:tetratricopeptide (TPR) repeat protein
MCDILININCLVCLFQGGYYELAVKRYKTIFNTLLSATLVSERDRQRSWELKFAAQSNLALCYLKLGNYSECKRSCETALAHDARHEKSIFRRGQAQLAMRNFDRAIEDFETVLEINPSNVEAQKQIEECHKQIKLHRIDEKEMYSSFFKKPPKKNTTDKVRNITVEN